MKKYRINELRNGVLVPGEILAENEEHAREICKEFDLEFCGEIIETLQVLH